MSPRRHPAEVDAQSPAIQGHRKGNLASILPATPRGNDKPMATQEQASPRQMRFIDITGVAAGLYGALIGFEGRRYQAAAAISTRPCAC